MIKLSRLTDYATSLLSHMGRGGEDSLWAASELAEASGLPLPTASKVLKLLAKSGIIEAQRGAQGGYKLARRPAAISIAEIIEAMDGPIAITDCAKTDASQSCRIKGLCPMSDGWTKVNRAVRQALHDVSLAEMCAVPPLPVLESP